MSPIVSTLAAASARGFGFATSGPLGDYVAIDTYAVPVGGQTTVTFSSIPNSYRHLQIRGISKGNSTGTNMIRFNGDAGSNYITNYLYGDGNALASGGFAGTEGYAILSPGSQFGAFVVDVLDYANTNKYKVVRSITGGDVNGDDSYIELLSTIWKSNTAINSVSLINLGTTFNQYSYFALYGIKAD